MKANTFLLMVVFFVLTFGIAFADMESEQCNELYEHLSQPSTQRSNSLTPDTLVSSLKNFCLLNNPSKKSSGRNVSLSIFLDSTWYFEYKILTWFYDRYDFENTITVLPESGQKIVYLNNQYDEIGLCTTGSELGFDLYEYGCIHGDNQGTILYDYYLFDLDGIIPSGIHASEYSDGTYSNFYNIRGGKIGSDTCSTTPEDGLYYIPYLPKTPGFILGFAFSNKQNTASNDVTITYYANDGQQLGSQALSIPAGGQIASMANTQSAMDGWAKVDASLPVEGMALVFGEGDEPMYDMDIITNASTSLIVNHVAKESGWNTRAMLANPNPSPAQVTIILHPKAGGSSSSESISIPAMGAVQYDLSRLGGEGSASINSNQPLAGFELYDGRTTGHKWLGGLSITESE